jgi:hypothetical protein
MNSLDVSKAGLVCLCTLDTNIKLKGTSYKDPFSATRLKVLVSSVEENKVLVIYIWPFTSFRVIHILIKQKREFLSSVLKSVHT